MEKSSIELKASLLTLTTSSLTPFGKNRLIRSAGCSSASIRRQSMGQNTAIVPEDIDALSMRSSSSMAALRSQSRRIQSLHQDTLYTQIVAAARNPVLATTHQNLNARLLRARYMANQVDYGRWAAAMREHELIVEALERREGDRIADLLLQHLQHKFEAIRTRRVYAISWPDLNLLLRKRDNFNSETKQTCNQTVYESHLAKFTIEWLPN